MIENKPQIKSSLWRASVLASLLLLLFAADTYAETDSARVARLFMWASDGNVRHRDLVDLAKDSLGQMGAKAAPWLAKKLNTSDARERLTLADIFEKIGKPATPFLIPYLEAPGEDTPRNTARCLERIKDTAAVIPLLAQMDHPEYSVRSQVATALGKTGDVRAFKAISIRMGVDPDSDVRKSCAVALGHLQFDSARLQHGPLLRALLDSSFGVRHAAERSLAKLRMSSVSQLESVADGLLEGDQLVSAITMNHALVALGGHDDPDAEGFLVACLKDSYYLRRGFAVEALTIRATEKSAQRIAKLKTRETDPFVLAQIARFEQIVLEKKNAESKPK